MRDLVVSDVYKRQVLGFEGVCDVKVSLGRLNGIEINDFAVRVAQTLSLIHI